jgi:hypothetical protein
MEAPHDSLRLDGGVAIIRSLYDADAIPKDDAIPSHSDLRCSMHVLQ